MLERKEKKLPKVGSCLRAEKVMKHDSDTNHFQSTWNNSKDPGKKT